MRRLTNILSLLAVAGVLTACHSKPNDETIAKDIQTKVASDPATQDSQVAVDSQEGKVTLKGAAKNPAAKQEIVKIAQEEPGVASVDDQTTMAGQDMSQAAAPVAPQPAPAPAPEPQAPPPPPPPPPGLNWSTATLALMLPALLAAGGPGGAKLPRLMVKVWPPSFTV